MSVAQKEKISTLPSSRTGSPFYMTAHDIAAVGYDMLPDGFVSGRHLIYSSPASLSFNSPGAEGYGVKRAALCIPGSVLLLVSPGCCGRNTSGLDTLPEYRDRFYFLNMDESDIVTGRHLKKIPAAVAGVVNTVNQRKGSCPSVVMICITCVDALLGTDMERVCRRAEEQCGVPVRPCYMYALTREGRRPPMVHIRQSLYSLLEKSKRVSTSINLIGNFGPLQEDCELYDIFRSMGIRKIREISTCKSFEEFRHMSEANFNVVLNSEALDAAYDMEQRLGIPYLELKRLYQPDKIKNQYAALAGALGSTADTEMHEGSAREAIQRFRDYISRHPYRPGDSSGSLSFAVGEFANADPFELALALIKEGFSVTEIFGTVSPDNFIYIKKLAGMSAGTRIYSNLEPTMLYYSEAEALSPDMVIGKDAAFYHPHTPGIEWREDVQPFGFAGVRLLFEKLLEAYCNPAESCYSFRQARHKEQAISSCTGSADIASSGKCVTSGLPSPGAGIHGLRKYLPPFAPDASGASSVLTSLGGITVICDAGGCAGNICGFDEPRWLNERGAVFSAGLRDMDAILGRDDRLVEKLKKAADSISAGFAAIIGTPVPSVIGTDYTALKRMSEKRTGLPTICINTTGMELYDKGAEKAYVELFSEFSRPQPSAPESCGTALSDNNGPTGIIGAFPIDTGLNDAVSFFKAALPQDNLYVYGLDGMGSVINAAAASKNIVVSPSGLKAARYLEKHFGTPFETGFPGAATILEYSVRKFAAAAGNTDNIRPAMRSVFEGRRILIIHQHILAASLAELISSCEPSGLSLASWFMTVKDVQLSGPYTITRLYEENDLIKLISDIRPDIIIGDTSMLPLIKACGDIGNMLMIELPHFAVSGRMLECIGLPY